jgi:hypothetical protein
MGKLLLNLNFGEPFALLEKLSCFDNSIELYVLLAISLHFGVHDPIHCSLLIVVDIELCRGQLLSHLRGVQQRWEIWLKQLHIKYWVQAKERGILNSKAFSPTTFVMV